MREKPKPGRPGIARRAAGSSARASSRPAGWVLALRTMVWATSAVVMIACGVTWFAYHSLTSGLTTSDALDAVKKKAPPHLDNSVNLLLVGLDSRKDMNGNDLPKQFVQDQLHAGSSEIGYYNTNTLILMHIPADGGKVSAFSIPRDDYVQTLNGDGSSQGEHKIKEAYANAYTGAHDRLAQQGVKGADLEGKSREAGREATLATVQDFTGVAIDHFAEVNLLGFYDIAKVLQPITVCLKHPVKDHYSGADFPAGVQQLNAKQALAFVRQRHGLDAGDLDRTRRQQAFISTVTHQLKSQGVWRDLGKLQGLFGVVKKDVVLDSSWNVLDFAQQAPNLTGGNVVFHTLPITGFAMRKGEDVNLVNPEKIKEIVQQAFGPSPSASASVSADDKLGAKAAPATVDVRNGNGTTGLADTGLKALTDLGYTAGDTGNAPLQAHTTVVYGSGAQQAAQQIAARLKTGPATASSSVPAGHVRVILGHNYTPPSSQTKDPAPQPSASASTDDSSGPAVKAGGVPCVN
ncbi:LCP family protein [Streptomyces sp. CBMA152]|uniref:LCP family protein n=1 Tax=Streptomyces sp. CBMA152 TaxID=1896312 RepID=UPI0016613FA5|nr:LCP family protein [Streptomyces sp. CBMA152]MBD0746707.1 LytR family transcriptional regulator [Streptomyces sp. CBMA152]